MKDILVGRCTTQAGSLAGRFSSPARLLCSASHFTGCLWGSVKKEEVVDELQMYTGDQTTSTSMEDFAQYKLYPANILLSKMKVKENDKIMFILYRYC